MTSDSNQTICLMKGETIHVTVLQLVNHLHVWVLEVKLCSSPEHPMYAIKLTEQALHEINDTFNRLANYLSTLNYAKCTTNIRARFLLDSVGPYYKIVSDNIVVPAQLSVVLSIGEQISFYDSSTNRATDGLVVAINTNKDHFTLFSYGALQHFTISTFHELGQAE